MALAQPSKSKGQQAAGSTITVTPSPTPSSSPSTTTHPATHTSTGPGPSTGGLTLGSSAANPKSVPLVVLNNTTVQGLAASAATQFRQGGWTVNDVGNLQNDILSTCAYFDPGDSDAEGAAQALQQQFPGIKRVRPKFSGLPSGPVVVVLTPDWSSQ